MDEGEFVALVEKTFPQDHDRIMDALSFAKQSHSGQSRRSGEAFITHPIAVAGVIMRFGHPSVDASTIMAALLHDVVEDTDATREDIEEAFGADVSSLVMALSQIKNDDPRAVQDERFFRQIKEASDADERVALIKIADQLHNNQSMRIYSPKRKKERALQAIEWYAPLAEEHGLHKEAQELRTQALGLI